MDEPTPPTVHAATHPTDRKGLVVHPIVVLVVVALACVLASRIAVHTMFVRASLVSFWPASAIALLAVFALHRWAYVGIFVGMAIVGFIWTNELGEPLARLSFVGVLVFALGATVEAFVGFIMCQHLGRRAHLSATVTGMASFVLAPGAVASLVGAAATMLAACLVWKLPWSMAPVFFLVRWLGATTCMALAAPFVSMFQSPPEERRARTRLLTLPLLLVLAVVTSIHMLVEQNRRHNLRMEFERDATTLRDAIDSRLTSHIELLFSVRSMIALHGPTQDAMHRFVQPLRARLPGIQAVEWVPRVRRDERAAQEERLRREAFPTFTITEQSADAKFVVAGDRAEYFPVQYIEPMEGNSTALGFDLGSRANRRNALEQARDVGRHVATGRILLVQETKRQYGLLMVLPHYDPELPKDAAVEQRRSNLRGFVVGVFRIGDILTSALSGKSWSRMDIAVEDENASPDERIFCLLDNDVDTMQECRADAPLHRPLFEVNESLAMGERMLRLRFSPSDRFLVERTNLNILLVHGLMCAIAIFIAAFFIVFSHRLALTNRLTLRTAELERSHVSLAKAKNAAEAANEAKGAFLSMVSHELRTPLSVILGYSELVAEDIASGQSSRALAAVERIRSSGEHLSAIINDVLDIARIEAGRLEIFPEDFDVPQLVRDLVQTFEPLVKKQGLELRVEVDETVGEMHADPLRVRQILYNLLGNAVKFTINGSVTVSVASDQAETGKHIVFRVSDTGIGIAKVDQEKLFRPFVQIDSSMARKYSGTGLGLSIVQHCVHAMNGTIELTSEVGVGTTFTVRLPHHVEVQQNSNETEVESP